MPRHRTGEVPQIQIGDSTSVSLRWVVAIGGAMLVIGGAVTALQVQAADTRDQVVEAKKDQAVKHEVITKELANQDKRTALLERAVLSLEEIARDAKKEEKGGR